MSTAVSFEAANYQPPVWEAISRAHALIAPRIHRTPIFTSTSLDTLAGARFFFKCENLQKTGSFKIRGAANSILSLSSEQAARGIVTQSSGNHGAAVACAAAWRGVPAYIVMPKNAPSSGGGLLSGTCLGAKGIRKDIRIIGCEPARADDAYRSLTTGTLESLESSDTIADGLRASLSPRTFAILRKHVDRILLVSEEEIIAITRLVWERMKIIVEPSSSVALAPLLKPAAVKSLNLPPRSDGKPPKLGVIFSGGNVDLNALPWLP